MTTTATNIRKKRGVVRASITKLDTRLSELERKSDRSGVHDQALLLSTRIKALDSEFNNLHFALIDTIKDDETELLDTEQKALDEHDETIDGLTIRIQHLITASGPTVSSELKALVNRLRHLGESITDVDKALDGLLAIDEDKRDIALIQTYKDELSDLKEQLRTSHDRISCVEDSDKDSVVPLYSSMKKLHFTCCHKIQRMIKLPTPERVATPTSATSISTSEGKGIKMPKLEAPTFDGNVLSWTHFWEQFAVSIDGNTTLTQTEKFVYLQQSLNNGSAKNVIDGLTGTGEHYTKAIECLKSRYDRPRLIHQSHVKIITEISSLKEGNGRELRKLHDTLQQHLRALDSSDSEQFSQFITSLIQLKLDSDTMFEWQKHTQEMKNVPHYHELLEFIDLRARASESIISNKPRNAKLDTHSKKPITSFVANSQAPGIPRCVSCKTEKHPLYYCPKFKSSSYDERLAIVKANNYCINCLRSGHFVKDCKSSHRCRSCQRLHHSLLHITSTTDDSSANPQHSTVASNAVTSASVITDALLMTCQVIVLAPNGSKIKVRCLLDSASSMSFASERLIQSLHIPRSHHPITISGIAGMSDHSPLRSIAHVRISPVHDESVQISVPAVVIPRVTCDLPLQPINRKSSWTHLSGIQLADPEFGQPDKIDLLLGIDAYAEVLLSGRRTGPPGSPVAFETIFGWVLAGRTNSVVAQHSVVSHHVSVSSSCDNDDLLKRFWEIEEPPNSDNVLTMEEREVVNHFKRSYKQNENGRFVVPLSKNVNTKPLGESRAQAVRRFMYLERSLHSRKTHKEFENVIQEYFDLGHAEIVPTADLDKTENDVFYLPLHVVYKASSTTTKVRAVFDGSAKSSTGTSLNDQLLVGPTVHSSLIDVLLRFRSKRIAITTDISKMYRAIELADCDRDLHRFVWRSNKCDTIKDYRMTRLTFGISASSFIANMCVKQNAINLSLQYPLAAKAVQESFYVDDGLTGSDNIESAIKLQKELQEMFSKGGFRLHKWNSSESSVLQQVDPTLRDVSDIHSISDDVNATCTKTLGLQWKTSTDQFHVTVSQLPASSELTKRSLISDIARLYDVFGWFSPTVIKVKILFQKFWELKIDWDEPAPPDILNTWKQWRDELTQLVEKPIPRCYYPKTVRIKSQQLHGFSDASEDAYSAVVYLRMTDEDDDVHISLVIAKTKVSPIKRLTIPRLELCGAVLLAHLLNHIKGIFEIPMHDVYAWTDSSVVLSWLSGSPKRFRTYVGNRVSTIISMIPPERWKHVSGTDNPADCASRGLFPTELINHPLWWEGPSWLKKSSETWPNISFSTSSNDSMVKVELCHSSIVSTKPQAIVDFKDHSSFLRLKRIVAWIFRFVNKIRPQQFERIEGRYLTRSELDRAETYIFSICQKDCFQNEIDIIHSKKPLSKKNSLLPLSPFIDSNGIMRVGGRLGHAPLPYSRMHPIILHGSHHLTKLVIRHEHQRLLHGGATLVNASLCRRFHIIRMRSTVRSVVRQCVPCRRQALKTIKPLLGQLPVERITPGTTFEKTGLDYAGPIFIKYGHVRKPVIVKSYVCVFVSLSVKAVHLELVSDLTTEAFISCLRRFISRRGYPTLLWSDHGTNFVGADREIKEFQNFIIAQQTQGSISEFCTANHIEWKFIPERSPHFGGLWESAVKSFKTHLRRVIGDTTLTYEEMYTVLTQIEACMNSRPLVPVECADDDGIELLTPGHFLIGRPIMALPNPAFSNHSPSLLKRWHLCQNLVQHFWKRWSTEYISTLQKRLKWQHPSRNVSIGDIVIVVDDNIIPTQWPIARITKTYPGKDHTVRVVDVRTTKGTYRRPTHKIAILLPENSEQ